MLKAHLAVAGVFCLRGDALVGCDGENLVNIRHGQIRQSKWLTKAVLPFIRQTEKAGPPGANQKRQIHFPRSRRCHESHCQAAKGHWCRKALRLTPIVR